MPIARLIQIAVLMTGLALTGTAANAQDIDDQVGSVPVGGIAQGPLPAASDPDTQNGITLKPRQRMKLRRQLVRPKRNTLLRQRRRGTGRY